MEKPILIAREELRQEIADTINNSNLHPIFIEPILEGFLAEVRASLNKQYLEEKAAYESELKKEQEAAEHE